MIAAMDKNNVIGLDNKMPWHLPADLSFFKQTTMGSTIIMGRKTYESIGRPLPGRLNIILSRDKTLNIDGCTVAHSLDEALTLAQLALNDDDDDQNDNNEVFITGGAHLYNKYIGDVERLYLTLIDAEFEGDTFFPDYKKYQWQEINRIQHDPDDKNPYPYTFLTLERLSKT